MTQPRWKSQWSAIRQKGESKNPLVYKAKDGTYWIELRAFPFGKSGEEGHKPKTYRRKGFASEAYAGAAVGDLVADVIRAKAPPAEPTEPEQVIILTDWLETWHQDRLKGAWTKDGTPIRPVTALHERRHMRIISAALGDLNIKRITEDHLVGFLRKMRRDDPMAVVTTSDRKGKQSTRPVSLVGKQRAQAQVWAVLQKALKAARKDRLIPSDPALGVEGPASRKSTPKPFRREELDAILAGADQSLPGDTLVDSDFATLVHLLWHSGCRIGEALALLWEDVDLERGAISISHSLTAVNGVGLVRGAPKTATSVRTVAIAPMMVERLKRLRATRGGIPLRNQFVFVSERGSPLRQSNLLRRRWHPLLKSLEIEKSGFHRMRHTHASFLLKESDHVTVQRRLGHADAATTLGIYGGSIKGQDEAAAHATERITRDRPA